MPAETLDRLAALGDRAVWVHGNCEREMVTAFDGGAVPGPNAADATASAALIGRAHRDRLDGLPLTVTLDIDGLGPTLFLFTPPRAVTTRCCWSTARRSAGPTRWTASARRWLSAATTHMPFDRLVAGHRVINPGSVGMPYGHPGAGWALLGPGVTLRCTSYDAEAAAKTIGASRHPLRAGVGAREYVLNHYSADEALEAFTAIARQQWDE